MAGRAAEAEHGVEVLALPKRSPNLQPLDCTFHKQIKDHLRDQENSWPRDKVETQGAFVAGGLQA